MLSATFFCACSQKVSIDSSHFGSWPQISSFMISPDGRYIFYSILNSKEHSNKGVVVSKDGTWNFEINNLNGEAHITDDSKFAMFKNSGDSLITVYLGTKKVKYIPGVFSYALSYNKQTKIIAFLDRANKRRLTIINLNNFRKEIYLNVTGYTFNTNGSSLLLEFNKDNNNEELDWMNLTTSKLIKMGDVVKVLHLKFDESGKQVVISSIIKRGLDTMNALLYYKVGMKEIEQIVSDDYFKQDGLTLGERIIGFNKSGSTVIFGLRKKGVKTAYRDSVYQGVVIWDWMDTVLPSFKWYFDNINRSETRWATINLDNQKVNWLTNNGETLYQQDTYDKFCLAGPMLYSPGYTGKIQRDSLFLISIETGRRKLITDKLMTGSVKIAPDEKFVIWYDADSLCYFDFDVQNGKKIKIGTGGQFNLFDTLAIKMGRKYEEYPVGAWSTRDHSVFLYDNFDVWKFDLLDCRKPTNITNGYGRQMGIVFGIVNLNYAEERVANVDNDQLLLTALDLKSKKNGLIPVKGRLDSSKIMSKMLAATIYIARTGYMGFDNFSQGRLPIRARNANCYLVTRESAEESLNLYLTNDFEKYRPISSLYPERKVVWLQDELVSWLKKDGSLAQGVMYKPENFSPSKKYPIIFYCYEKMSNNLHHYFSPDWSAATIDIPYYVSNGYLVFTPDITWTKGQMAEGVLDAINSAVVFLKKISWIDSTKFGIQGHSFGGWVTNLVATHSHCFAAACAVSGITDEVSGYDELLANGRSFQPNFEFGQGGYYGAGFSPWANLQTYIENSPIFETNKTVTPLLLVHGNADENVPFQQSLELFLALRGAGKSSWLLEYKNAKHILYNRDAVDFTLRMKEYFDYYLQSKPMPKWMGQQR